MPYKDKDKQRKFQVEKKAMGLHFRYYKDRSLFDRNRRTFRLGWVLYDRHQPTLDILIGSHVFVVFWKRKDK